MASPVEEVSVRVRRRSADERREEILTIANEHFAIGGCRGTSTDVIAREARISQPYLFQFFRTKQEPFLACNARACEKVLETFRAPPAGRRPVRSYRLSVAAPPHRIQDRQMRRRPLRASGWPLNAG